MDERDYKAMNRDLNQPVKDVSIDAKERELVDKWIMELSDAGYTHDDMIAIFREARRKYDDYKKRNLRANS